MEGTLASLPPSCLELITWWLPYDSAVKLAKLTGSLALWTKFTALGGVTDVVVNTTSSASFFIVSLPLLSSFKNLTCLVIDTFKRTDICAVLARAPWMLKLPSTMLEIRLSFPLSCEAFVQSAEDVMLPDSPSSSLDSLPVSGDGRLPMALEKHFPKLRTLRANFERWPDVWMHYFFKYLPSSLTHLEPHLSIVPGEELDKVWETPNLLSHLFRLKSIKFGSLEKNIPLDPMTLLFGGGDHYVAQDKQASTVPLFEQLESLRIWSLPCKPNFFSTGLSQLSSLTSLDIYTGAGDELACMDFVLPPSLTELSLEFDRVWIDPNKLLRSAPRLITVKLSFKAFPLRGPPDPGAPVRVDTPITYWPHDLTDLTYELPNPIECPLPSTLTRLWLRDSIPTLALLHLEQLPKLSYLRLHKNDLTPSLLWPPSLTEVNVGLLLSAPLRHLAPLKLIPNSVTRLNAGVGITFEDLRDELFGIKTWNFETIANHLHQRYWPQITRENLNLQLFCNDIFPEQMIPGITQDLVEFDSSTSHFWFSFSNERPLPSTLTKLDVGPCIQSITLAYLPEGLTDLSYDGMWTDMRIPSEGGPPKVEGSGRSIPHRVKTPHGDQLVEFHRCNPGADRTLKVQDLKSQLANPLNRLPPNLTALSLGRMWTMENATDSQSVALYPFIHMANKLTKMEADFLDRTRLQLFVDSLPPTITDLQFGVGRYVAGKHSLVFESTRLPDLKRLCIKNLEFDFEALSFLLPRLDYLNIHKLWFTPSMFLRQGDEGLEYLDANDLRRMIWTRLFPRHLRCLTTELVLQWDRESIQLLPRSLSTLHLDDIDHAFLADQVEQFSFPNSLTRLSIDLNCEQVPLTAFLGILPKTLLVLSATFENMQTFTKDVFGLLPRSLTRLDLREQRRNLPEKHDARQTFDLEEHEMLSSLPPSLKQLSLLLWIPFSPRLNWLQLLPRSLVSLAVLPRHFWVPYQEQEMAELRAMIRASAPQLAHLFRGTQDVLATK